MFATTSASIRQRESRAVPPSAVSSSVKRAERPVRDVRSGRRMLSVLAALGALVAAGSTAVAQGSNASPRALEARITGGAFVPTGDQRSHLKDAQATAAQLSWVFRPSLALTGTFTWARSRDRTTTANPKLDVFSTDLGVEARPVRWFAERTVSFSPFAGVGVGARHYNSRERDVDTRSGITGYGAAGGEVGVGRVGVRMEVRNYATHVSARAGQPGTGARNDVVFLAALRFNRQRPASNE